MNRGRGQGQGQGNRQGRGPVGNCVCPSCKEVVEHIRGKPCTAQICPKCGAKMIRQ